MNAIEIKNLSKKYKNITAVNNISLNVEQGKLFSLLGVNGAGKTTTIKILTGLAKKSSGEAYVMGKSVDTDIDSIKKIIGVSTQETAVAGNLTIEENLKLICGIFGYSKEVEKKKIDDMVNVFELHDVLHQKAKTLSGGYSRKLSIAMALICNPQVLFLDEPTLGLDVLARRELWKVIKSLKGKTTVVLTTHYMEEAQMLSDEIAIMVKGEVKALGTLDELLSRTGETDLENAFVKIAGGDIDEN